MNIYLLDDEKRNLVMHTLSGISQDDQIPLGIEVKEAGTYAITFGNTEGFQASSGLFLVDKQENTVTAVTSSEAYTFTITDVTKPITNRFYLTSNASVSLAGEVGNWLDAYPNPVVDQLTISIQSDEIAHGALYDSQGKVVWVNAISGTQNLDLQTLPSGMYFLKVQLGSDVQWRKIIK
jgi:hypothetical protein